AAAENLSALAPPYDLYTDEDIARRTVYAETSRGCPHPCAYCTSASTKLRLFPLDTLLPALDRLLRRGVRQIKFLDRTFNAHPPHACAILDFFLSRPPPSVNLHFEINPDHLHPDILDRISAFPPGALHLEVGVQTLNPSVAAAIGRSPDTAKTLGNVRRLTRDTGATVHADLIFGLPGEDEASFVRGFDTLIAEAAPPEVQVNLLKGLPGTRLLREAPPLGLAFSPDPPYEVLRTDVLDFATLRRIQRFARCWELVHNRNRFPVEVARFHAMTAPGYYRAYSALADRIFSAEGKLHAISQARLAQHLEAHLREVPKSV
ncbi:MAG: DUF4080 domain-containing protein, partial [Kiritimatiellaeota bacterium]|nr:DUF4080 domain-containing protein [Kiritimatiellota bacterium]